MTAAVFDVRDERRERRERADGFKVRLVAEYTDVQLGYARSAWSQVVAARGDRSPAHALRMLAAVDAEIARRGPGAAMSVRASFHISGTPAEVDGFSDFVTLDIADGKGSRVAVFFADREELVRWLDAAREAALALPAVVEVAS